MNVITKSEFGQYEGQAITQFTLSNANGVEVKIINYGATITSFTIPTDNNGKKEIVCGFNSMDGYQSEAYKSNAPYFGCTVGRYASRIKDGKFQISGKDYTLAVNNGSNHLHGGIIGFDKKVWSPEVINDGENQKLKMSLESADMEEGYPGYLKIELVFSLSEDNSLSMKYEGVTDKDTPLSLTNHSYFNLSGFVDTIHSHQVKINANKICQPDETNVPVGVTRDVSGTIEDLSGGRKLGDCFEALETGFEHYYIFEHELGMLSKVAEITEPSSQYGLEIYTTEPGALFYTGYFTSDELQREDGDQYGRYRGLCFETSRYPNGPNIEGSPGSITTSAAPYSSETIFKIINEKPV